MFTVTLKCFLSIFLTKLLNSIHSHAYLHNIIFLFCFVFQNFSRCCFFIHVFNTDYKEATIGNIFHVNIHMTINLLFTMSKIGPAKKFFIQSEGNFCCKRITTGKIEYEYFSSRATDMKFIG